MSNKFTNAVQHHLQDAHGPWVILLEENIGKQILDIGLGNDLLDKTPKAQATKADLSK